MVKLTLQTNRGNNSRAWPFTGYLGLTPVTLHGSLSTYIEEDKIELEASSVIVRAACYEGDISCPGGAATASRRLFEVSKVLWTPSGGSRFAALGDFQHAWHLTIPPNAREQGAVSTLNFKTWRVWWVVEAVVNHRPSGIFGTQLKKSHPLLLVQHALPRVPLAPPTIRSSLDHRSLYVKAMLAESALGPGDPLALKLLLRKRSNAEAGMAIKRVVIDIRRSITRRSFPDSNEGSCSPAASDSPPTPPFGGSSESVASTPLSTPDGIDPHYFALTAKTSGVSPLSAERQEETTLVSLVVDGKEVEFARDGTWTTSLHHELPRNKSIYHYSLGESIDVSTFAIKCFVHVKVVFKGKTMEPLELPPAELFLAPISSVERNAARQSLHKIMMVQEAERKLFQPREDGTCRASDSRRGSAATGSSVRRYSDQDSPKLHAQRGRFHSVVDYSGEFFEPPLVTKRTSSASDTTSKASKLPTETRRASVDAHRPSSRGRFLSVDEQVLRAPVSPIIEVEATPRVSSHAIPYLGATPSLAQTATPRLPFDARPFTPPSDNDPPAAAELFKNFAGFSLKPVAAEMSPPSSPPKPSSRRPHGVSPIDRPSSPIIPSPPLLLRVQSRESAANGEGTRGSLSRLFGRRSSKPLS